MEYLISFLVSLAAAEVYCFAPAIARHTVECAVCRLPETHQNRYREEWLAHLDDCPGHLMKLWHAVGCFYGVAGIEAAGPDVAETKETFNGAMNLSRAEAKYFLEKRQTLTKRQQDVLDGLVEGYSNKGIAVKLSISQRTVEIHRANVMRKMQASNLSDLIRMALTVR